MDFNIIEYGIQLECRRYAVREALDSRLSEMDRNRAARLIFEYDRSLEKIGGALLAEFDHSNATAQ